MKIQPPDIKTLDLLKHLENQRKKYIDKEKYFVILKKDYENELIYISFNEINKYELYFNMEMLKTEYIPFIILRKENNMSDYLKQRKLWQLQNL